MARRQLLPAPEFNKVFCVHSKTDDISIDDWKSCFSEYGNILSVHVAKNKSTGQPTGYTYIEFEKTSSACLAMEEMDNKQVKPNTRTIRVHLAHKKEDNLEIDVELDHLLERLCIKHGKQENEDAIRSHFEQFGTIIRVNVLKDKQTRTPIGITFIKFSKQSECATALEDCSQNYKPRWADVRKQDPEKIAMQQHAQGYGMDDGYGGGYGMEDPYMMGGGMGGGMGRGGGRGGGRMAALAESRAMGAMGAMASARAAFGNGDLDSGPRSIEAMVPPTMTRKQVFKLFDIAPGLFACDVHPETGLVRVEYMTGKQAAHAKEKIDGLDVFGQTVAIRFAKGGKGLGMGEEPGMGGMGGMGMHDSMGMGMGGGGGGRGGGGEGTVEVPWCSVPLPPRRPLLPVNSIQKGKCFIMTHPDAVPNEMLVNAFCRFGSLIMCQYQPGKRFAFANYGSKDAAEEAIETLNQASFWYQGQEFQLKVEISNQGAPAKYRGEENDGENAVPRKRTRQF